MSSFASDLKFSRQLLPAFNEAAREFVFSNRLINLKFTEAPLEVDRNEGIDMFCEQESTIVFAYRALRANRSQYFDYDFTIRYSNQKEGYPSEWEKILNFKYASYILAGLQHNEDELALKKVKLISVERIQRQVLCLEGLMEKIEETTVKEVLVEKGKYFLAIPYDIFPDSVVVDELVYK
jgi:hypothetical protein